MKVYRSAPIHEFRIVKPDAQHDVYEVWVTRPVCVGSISRLGNSNLVTDDNKRFKNIFYAAQHVLERAKETGLTEGMRLNMASSPRNINMTGLDLLNNGKWYEFRKLRNMDGPVDELALRKQYSLNPDECASLGIDK